MWFAPFKSSRSGTETFNDEPLKRRESAVSNFHTNLYGAIKSSNITAQSTPDFGHWLSNPPGTAHVSKLFLGRIDRTEDFVSSAIFLPFYFVFWAVSSFIGARRLLDVRCLRGCWPYGHACCGNLLRQRTLHNITYVRLCLRQLLSALFSELFRAHAFSPRMR